MVEQVEESTPPVTGDTSLPDILFDKIELGMSAALPRTAAADLAGVARRLHEAGLVRRPPSQFGERGGFLRVDFLSALPDGGEAQIEGRLYLGASSSGSVVVGRHSHLLLNGMRTLRARLPCAPPSSFTGDNFIGAHDAGWAELLKAQVDDLAATIDAFLAGLAAAMGPGPLAGDIRLKSCELCRDHREDDAEAVARAICAVPAPGMVQRMHRYPAPTLVLTERDRMVASWDDGQKRRRIVSKIYAKDANLLRTEVALTDIEAVARLLGDPGSRRDAARVAFRGAGPGRTLAGLLLRVAVLARPRLDALDGFRRATTAPAPALLDHLIGFAPLLQVAHPAPRTGRPPAAETATTARQALAALFLAGRFDARGVRGTCGARRALDAMASGPFAVLDRAGPRRTLYVLRPAAAGFAAAVTAAISG